MFSFDTKMEKAQRIYITRCKKYIDKTLFAVTILDRMGKEDLLAG
jgi:hypothetical protein